MRLPPLLPPFGLTTCALLLLLLPLFGSSHPAQTPGQPALRLVERFNPPGLRFNWRNITCPVCKAVFIVLDIALLVRAMHMIWNHMH